MDFNTSPALGKGNGFGLSFDPHLLDHAQAIVVSTSQVDS
jgi:hypothetical protein